MDCVPDSKLKFCHAKLKNNGYIRIGETRYSDDTEDETVFHRNMFLEEFETPIFNNLEEAVKELPNHDGETFVMAFSENQGCETLWFMPEQIETGLLNRLNIYKVCYGKYEYSIYSQ